jgi:hypothetical protein
MTRCAPRSIEQRASRQGVPEYPLYARITRSTDLVDMLSVKRVEVIILLLVGRAGIEPATT